MKVVTAAEMREVDRRTVELGIPDAILMENAGHRVVEFLVERFSPLSAHRIVILCGKGNNGGDGFVIARQLLTRFHPLALTVVAMHREAMFQACGGEIQAEIGPALQHATLIIDALLGTGLEGPARGRSLDQIRQINATSAAVVAVDLPSGMASDGGSSEGEVARSDATVTFTAPKPCHVLPPNADRIGELRVAQIGSPASLLDNVKLHVTTPGDFARLLRPRERDSNKGSYGHVLVIGGSKGKTGAAEMAGTAALRAGAGLVTVASTADKLAQPELMTASLHEIDLHRKTTIALGPGLGEAVDLARNAVTQYDLPMVIDADGLNALAEFHWHANGKLRVLTPHPGEMSRLTGKLISEVQQDRIGVAREYASRTASIVVLKGDRTIIAMPDGRAYINPTGTPALAKGGTGDVLTGIVAGLLAQFPVEAAVLAAVYLHGLAGQIGARQWGDKCLLATDLLNYLPEAMRECASVSHCV
ncbi:MAG: NAD(P)H-hydrate dehydratase [Bryobacteraceae bacterium]